MGDTHAQPVSAVLWSCPDVHVCPLLHRQAGKAGKGRQGQGGKGGEVAGRQGVGKAPCPLPQHHCHACLPSRQPCQPASTYPQGHTQCPAQPIFTSFSMHNKRVLAIFPVPPPFSPLPSTTKNKSTYKHRQACKYVFFFLPPFPFSVPFLPSLPSSTFFSLLLFL